MLPGGHLTIPEQPQPLSRIIEEVAPSNSEESNKTTGCKVLAFSLEPGLTRRVVWTRQCKIRYEDIPRAATGQTASTRSFRTAYMRS